MTKRESAAQLASATAPRPWGELLSRSRRIVTDCLPCGPSAVPGSSRIVRGPPGRGEVDRIRELTQDLIDELIRVARTAQDFRSGLVGPEIAPAERHNVTMVLPLPTTRAAVGARHPSSTA